MKSLLVALIIGFALSTAASAAPLHRHARAHHRAIAAHHHHHAHHRAHPRAS